MKYLVRYSNEGVYLGKHGSTYQNTVLFHQTVFADGMEVYSQLLRRDFPTSDEAVSFSRFINDQFVQPSFREYEEDFAERHGLGDYFNKSKEVSK